jgi:hypothetical protein
MKKFVALSAIVLMLSFGAFAKGSKSSGSWDGWISDAKCGAKVNADCAKKCIAGGEKMVFVTDKDKKVIPISNPDALKGHEGHHVNVKGSVKDGALTVQSASMLPDQSMK